MILLPRLYCYSRTLDNNAFGIIHCGRKGMSSKLWIIVLVQANWLQRQCPASFRESVSLLEHKSVVTESNSLLNIAAHFYRSLSKFYLHSFFLNYIWEYSFSQTEEHGLVNSIIYWWVCMLTNLKKKIQHVIKNVADMKEEMGKKMKILTQAKMGLWGSYRGRRGYVHICPLDSITTLQAHE